MKTSRRAALAALLLAILGPAAGRPVGAAHLLRDLSSGPPGDSDFHHNGYLPPAKMATVQGRAVFLVDAFGGAGSGLTPGPQVALWASDGTSEGTELLAAFCTDGFEGCELEARFLGKARGIEFLAVPETGPGKYDRWELWRTDGTSEGTYQLPAEMCDVDHYHENGATEAVADGFLYFAGTGEDTRCLPWRSDGTEAGTAPLEIRPPAGANGWSHSFAALGDRAFFATGEGIWTVDAASGVARLLRRLPGVRLITPSGSRLFFLAAEDMGEALWVSDGERGGDTRRLHSLREDRCRDCDPPIQFLKALAGGVIFQVTIPEGDYASTLWRSDGTETGTYPVHGSPRPGHFGLGYFTPETFAEAGARVLFAAGQVGKDVRLWTAPGLPSSAALLEGCAKGCPVPTSHLQPLPSGKVVFTGSAPRASEALWVSDGTAAGTLPLRHVCRGACSEPVSFVPLGGSAYLGVKDADGPALWRTDGTAEGTVLLARVALPYQPEGALVGDQALLGVSDATRISELWATDGSPAGTRRVRTFARSASSSLPSFLSFGDGVLFTAQIGPGVGWWRSDGSSTRKLRDLCSPCYFSSQQVAVGGLAYTLGGYPENSGLVSPHLFRTDGTQEGTREILALGSDFSARTPFAFAGKLFFLRCGTADAEPGTNLHKCGIWASDGTPEGTGPRIVSLPATNYFSTLVVGNTLYFSLFGRHGTSIYQSDGTEAGTRRVARFIPYTYAPSEMAVAGGRVFVDAEGSLGVLDASAPDGVRFLPGGYVIGLRELGGRLLFFASSGEDPGQAGLWSTDGTPEGTRFLAPVVSEPLGPYPFLGSPEWTPLGSRLVFRGWDPEHGFELWVTDGTPEGTGMLADIAPGPASSLPRSLVLAGDRVWLTADDGPHGRELWVTDGTPAGTRLAVELAPGPFSLAPDGLTLGGGNLFFSADAPFTGREPWVLPLQ